MSGISVTNNGATVNDNGKLGKCYYFNGNAQYLQLSATLGDLYSHDFSYSVWLKPTDSTRSIIMSDYASSGASGVAYELTTSRSIRLYWNGSPDIYPSNCVLPLDTWTHTAIVKTTNQVDFYVNGELRHTYTGTLVDRVSSSCLRIGDDYRGGSSVSYMGYMNDVRIYDHALSPKEVKLISQGLVAHYQLNDPYSTSNLFPNGFGQDGALGWTSSSSISTTEIPPNQPTIKASYYGGNMTTSYIPISHSTDYTINMYIKATSGATGNVYPSLYPYDVDKKFIDYHKCTIGFANAYKTTLAQPLHKGDTVIYATNLSAWTTATDNHYFHVAIFGYADSTGYVYPDMGYTADSPSFGSKTDKSNIDKTNNTITLLAPFTGEDRPAGTTICQATEGATYFYPYGGISVSTIADWTYKTAVIDVNNTRLRFAKYVNFMSYWGAYYAGIQLIDNNANQIVYDSSGYNNHGKIGGSLLSSPDTPRNNISTYFATNSETVTIPAWWSSGQEIDKMSVSIWFKTDTLNSTAPNLWSLGENSFVRIRIASATSIWYYMQGTSGTYAAGKTLTDNTWHHVVFVFNSGVVTIYLDNVQIGTTDHSATKPTMTVNSLKWHLAGYSATSEKFIGNLSDFRVYATALSSEDVQTLYNAPVSVANNGAMLTQGEFVEV